MGANAMLNNRLSPAEILQLAIQIEGHPDNAAAAFHGGLVLVVENGEDYLVRKLDILPERLDDLCAAVAIPQIHLPTRVARSALPKEVSLADAVFNSARTALVIEALRAGDLDLLGLAMQDRLHQPYRLRLVSGAEAAMAAARAAGCQAVAISGAGPSLVAFGKGNLHPISDSMVAAFMAANVTAQGYVLGISLKGASVDSVPA
jgi:homoserine kinase